jgi:hypothetical protein
MAYADCGDRFLKVSLFERRHQIDSVLGVILALTADLIVADDRCFETMIAAIVS